MGQIQGRFAFFVEKSGYTKQHIEKKLGLSNGYIGKIVTGKVSFGVDILEKIMATFTELNPVWLTTGGGEMFVHTVRVSTPPLTNEAKPSTTELEALIEKILHKKLDELLQKRGAIQ